jgi:hypothetical protein
MTRPRATAARRLAAALALTLAGLAASLAGPRPAAAQAPTFRQVAGHDFGERITYHHQMVRYLDRLAEASPRVAVIQQGESWQGRSLPLAIVTATPDAAIHGFELSGTEGVLKLLEHLATRDDAATLEVLRNTVVLLDPILNPDGRDAFAHFNYTRLGHAPNARHDDWSNATSGWEGLTFRTGHYFFDTHRDPNRAAIQAWRPQVMIDAHEMGRGCCATTTRRTATRSRRAPAACGAT